MKITFLLPHLRISGGGLVLLTYADWLSRFGHQVKIAVVNPTKKRWAANLLNYKPGWLRGFNLRFLRVKDLGCLPPADFLVFSAWAQARALAQMPLASGRRIYFIQHDERLYHGDRELVAQTYRLNYKKIAVSSWLKEMLSKEFSQPADLLLNSVNKEVFNTKFLRRRLGKIRIMLLAHSYEWKGTKDGVSIVKALQEKYKNIELVLFGARQKNIAFGAEYHYQKTGLELAKVYASCDIYLCPSWDEGFGLPSLEAMACGCALVTYDNGGSRDFAFDGQTALVAKRRQVADLKNKLELLVKDEKLRKKIAQAGLDFVKNYPSWEEQARKLEKILESEK